ncbi:NAD(P)H-dependent oxidoreductase [uncultured Pseudoteredinibacter sp.]|uniref:FMN-dependent NADH-azoreductase n=1 Tax=uncultured Pseudoteredinibacter sp. TaxID=1641701 RepID=UPI0026295721|nr:NAD(P)H-dependent oxidoreductase [uncultured Pseudoteredinibacter sp.]
MSSTNNILVVNSSARKTRSISRELSVLFTESFRAHKPCNITQRDVGMNPPSFITEDWIAAAFNSPEQRSAEQKSILQESDQLIDEVVRSDIIVLGAPMYNYSMPASLKAWFDLIARVGLTFSFDLSRGDYPIEPVLRDKKLVLLSSRGEFAFAPGGERAHLNGLDPALHACAHYLGVEQECVNSIVVEYEEFKDKRWLDSLEQARQQTRQLAYQMAGAAS